jgi:hypothetical protein
MVWVLLDSECIREISCCARYALDKERLTNSGRIVVVITTQIIEPSLRSTPPTGGVSSVKILKGQETLRR